MAKIKFDRQNFAFARVAHAFVIYTDDYKIGRSAKALGIPTQGLADLPPVSRECAGAVAFRIKENDAIDEVAERLKEPEPEDQHPAEGIK